MTTSNTSPAVPPQARFFQWIQGWASLILCHSLTKAGVFEQLAGQPRRLEELAAACRLHTTTLYRALRMTTALEITTREGERYTLTPIGRLLLKDAPGSMVNAILLASEDGYQRPWQNFTYSLTTGESAFTHVMGMPFFDYLETHPELGLPFQQQQIAYASMIDPALVPAYDFMPFHSVCDVGGGAGSFLKLILETNPHLRGILYDLPGVVKNHVLGGLVSRADIRSGNFFERVPAADLLVLKTVLHDWSDDKCAVILSRCREAMQPAARLLIVDRVITEPIDPISAFYDLHMLVQIGGRERTAAEFETLLQNAGLTMLRIIVPGESPLFPLRLIEASLSK